jgi:hypothetical protein
MVEILLPGDLLEHAIHAVKGVKPCPLCRHRRDRMNAWGWWGCWCNRRRIMRWLVESAERSGIALDQPRAFALLKSAFKAAGGHR